MDDFEQVNERRKVLIDKVVSVISSKDPNLYYESTINICRQIHEVINNEDILTVHEKEIFKGLEPKDIQILLSYNSNCC